MFSRSRRFVPFFLAGTLVQAQEVWVPRAPTPTSQEVVALACSPQRCLAASGDGILVETSDGRTWNRLLGIPPGIYWQSLEWTGSKFLAVGMYGWGLSGDGLRWEFQELNMSRQTWPLAAGGWTGNGYLLVGMRDSALFSNDGASWKADSLRCGSGSMMGGHLAQGGGKVVVGFYAGTGCASGDSGRTWREVTDSAGNSLGAFWSVGFDGERFQALANDGIWESVDGVRWTLVLDGRSMQPRAFHCDTSRSVAIGWDHATGRDVVWAKPRGGRWEIKDSFDLQLGVRHIGRAAWGYVALGAPGNSMTSTDGLQWSFKGPDGDLNSVAHGKDAFFAAGNRGRLVGSTDGSAWSSIDLSTTLDLRAIASDGSRMVVVGDSGALWSSLDGATWIRRDAGTRLGFLSAVWTGKVFVAAGDSGTLMESSDGSVWKSLGFTGKANFQEVVALGETIFVRDAEGKVWGRSGGDWRAMGPASKAVALGAHAPEGLVVSDADGGVWSTVDGASWKRPTMFGTSYAAFFHTGRNWLAFGSTLASSVDGVDWPTVADGLYGARSMASDGTRLVAVGGSGRIWTSEIGSGASLRPFRLQAAKLELNASRGKLTVTPAVSGAMEVRIQDVAGRFVASHSLQAVSGRKMTIPLPVSVRSLVATVRQGGRVGSMVVVPAMH